jgi:spoIIIJ-associated protein
MAQRFEGKNLEDALDAAAQAFGVQRYQLTYHVVLEKRGFLGGMKRVVIEADINETAAEPEAAAPVGVGPRSSAAAQPETAAASRGNRGRRGGRGTRPERGGRRRERNDDAEQLQPGDFAEFALEVPEQGPESEGAAAVREWCERVLALAKLELQLRSEENDSQVIIRLYGRDTRRLIEKHGEVLDALQVLANKALVGRKIEKDVELDCQEFKGKRIEELEQKARKLADQVRRDGREQLLPAMTPIERRIVHLALQDDGEVTTQSRGEGFYKRVAIVRRAAQPEPTPTAS